MAAGGIELWVPIDPLLWAWALLAHCRSGVPAELDHEDHVEMMVKRKSIT